MIQALQIWFEKTYNKQLNELEDTEIIEMVQNELDTLLGLILTPTDPTNLDLITFYQTRYLVLLDVLAKIKQELKWES